MNRFLRTVYYIFASRLVAKKRVVRQAPCAYYRFFDCTGAVEEVGNGW